MSRSDVEDSFLSGGEARHDGYSNSELAKGGQIGSSQIKLRPPAPAPMKPATSSNTNANSSGAKGS